MSNATRGQFLGHALSCALLAVAVCVSALLAHVGIDIVGDFALPHDTYDDVAHASRTWVVLAAAGLLCLGAVGVIWSALDQRGFGRASAVQLGLFQRPLLAGIAVFVLALGAVVSMEALDAALAGDDVANLSVALGGSVWLGLIITFASGLVSTFAALRVARCIARAQSLLFRVFVALAVQLRLRVLPVGPRFERTRPPVVRVLAVLLGRAHKRGPPLAV